MRIIRLSLYKYKRFPLLGANLVTIDFEKKLNLILGTNGSGKSSLMKELSPLPALREDFYADGFKIIEIEHQHKYYKLSSEFKGSGASYSFIVDDEELNTAHLLTMQKFLCEQHFSITQDIFDILTGQLTFTSMSSQQRKKLINQVSSSNIDDVLNVYEEFKELKREKELGIKTLSSLLLAEKEKLLDEDDLISLQKKKEQTQSQIDYLLHMREEIKSYRDDSDLQIQEQRSRDVLNHFRAFLTKHYNVVVNYDRKSITQSLNQYNAILETIRKEQQQLNADLTELEEKIKMHELIESLDAKELTETIDENNKRIEDLRSSASFFKDLDQESYNETLKSFHSASSILIDIFTTIEINSEQKVYNKMTYSQNLKIKELYETEIREKVKLIEALKAKIAHIKSHIDDPEIQCPKCTFKWNPNYNVEEFNALEQKLIMLEKSLEETMHEKEEIDRFIVQCENYFNSFRQYVRVKESYLKYLKPLFDYIDEELIFFNDPRSIHNLLNRASIELSHCNEILNLQMQNKNLHEKIEMIKISSSHTLKHFRDNYNRLIDKFNDNQEEILKVQKLLSDMRVYLNIVDDYRLSVNDLKEASVAYRQSINSYIAKDIMQAIDETLRVLKIDYVHSTGEVSQQDKIHAIVSDYEKTISSMKEDLTVIETIVACLSPKDGLIAKTIGNFINIFIHDINDFISKIWSYPFEIVPYDIEGDDKLDYRFRVVSNDKTQSPDITKTSSGMREIIDLAFKLTMMKLLHMQNYPLYLDEFGARLDAEHKSNIFSVVFNFINDSNYSQIFMITHTDKSFANIKNTDIITLDHKSMAFSNSENIVKLS